MKLRFTRRSGAGGIRSLCDPRVVRAFLLRPPHPNKLASRIRRATRFLLAHLTPSALNSKWILGAPYVSRLSLWMRAIFSDSRASA